MRRHLVFLRHFDTRCHSLEPEGENWEQGVKENHRFNQAHLVHSLGSEFGTIGLAQTVRNFKDVGPLPFSIVAYHNSFLDQVRRAFVSGAYYPALTGAGALGERILNHLMLDLREDFKASPYYKKLYRKKSVDDWDTLIDVLKEWNVLRGPVSSKFEELKNYRNRSIHFNHETYADIRNDALIAIKVLNEIISQQFGFIGEHWWRINDTAGAFFIRKEATSDPFIRKYYLAQCPLVGPLYSMSGGPARWYVHDFEHYPDREISDEEFAKLFTDRAFDSLIDTDYGAQPGIIIRTWG